MRHGCGFFRGSVLGEREAGLVAAEVVALVFLGDVAGPVGVQVAVGADGAEPQDGLGSFQAPSGAGDAHPVVDQLAAGAFDDAGGDGPPFGEGAGVVQVGGLGGQVGQGGPDDLVVLAAGPGRVRGGEVLDPADDLAGPAVQDVQALGGDPVLGGRVAGGVEAPGGFPQVFQHVDEIDQDRHADIPVGGLGADEVDLVSVPVGQCDPGPGVSGVAALGLAEDRADSSPFLDGTGKGSQELTSASWKNAVTAV
jgi:hypothetical protein